MKMRTGTDLELKALIEAELKTLLDYVETFDDMTKEEKDELREWLAHGNSVNSNPFLIYGDNGCLMDFVNASRFADEMAADRVPCPQAGIRDGTSDRAQDPNLPF
jgi:hypothetical protein